MRSYSRLTIVFLALTTFYSQLFAQDEKKRLIGAIEQSIAILDALSPYDFVGETEESNIYGEEIVAEGNFRFRLRVDLDAKEMCFGLDSKSITDMRLGNPKCSFRGVSDTICRSSDNDGSFKEEKFGKYGDAINSSGIPILSDCNLADYSKLVTYPADPSKLAKLIARVNDASAGVQVVDDGKSTVYTLRISEAGERASHYAWKFSSLDGLLLEFTVEYEYVLGQPKSLATRQTIVWEEFAGRTVPHLILCESKIVRRKDHPTIKNFGESGRYITETEFKWLSVGEQLRKEPKMDLSKAMGVKTFIHDGLMSR